MCALSCEPRNLCFRDSFSTIVNNSFIFKNHFWNIQYYYYYYYITLLYYYIFLFYFETVEKVSLKDVGGVVCVYCVCVYIHMYLKYLILKKKIVFPSTLHPNILH